MTSHASPNRQTGEKKSSARLAAASAFDDAPVAAEPDEDGGGPSGPINGDGVFDGCPVTPLGYDGDLCFYLDVGDQLRAVETHTQDRIVGLFGGREHELRRVWPRFGKGGADGEKPKPVGWDHAKARAALVAACFERGKWNAMARVRGVGAWPADDADAPPVLHCGDAVFTGADAARPGLIGERVYPAGVRQPRPWSKPVPAAQGPGEQVLAVLRTWALANGDDDARLILGWICAAMFGGALDWRPMIWLTGGAGSGKSYLDKLLAQILGGESAIVQSSDASEPAIRQALGMSSLPVLLDEIESEAEGARAKAVIKLARQAASNGVVMRGGADNKSVTEFRAQSCFKFSSILIPSLGDQDASRLAVIDLMPLARDAAPPRLDARSWGLTGRRLRRRILDDWWRWRPTLEAYRAALAESGHSARGCDQFGTLLAMADLALHQGGQERGGAPDADSVEIAIAGVTAARVASRIETADSWERCLRYLGAQVIGRHIGGAQVTLAEMVAAAADLTGGDPLGPKEANREIGRCGLRVIGRGERATVAVANTHDGLRKLFDGSRWATERGQTGVWSQDVRRTPLAVASSSSNSFAGVMARSWIVPIAAFTDTGAAEAEAGAAAGRDVMWEG